MTIYQGRIEGDLEPSAADNCEKVTEVTGSLRLRWPDMHFAMLERVGGDLTVQAKRSWFPNLRDVEGAVSVRAGTGKTRFPSLRHVGGETYISAETDFRDLREVGGALHINAEGCSFPNLKTVAGDFFATARAVSLERLEVVEKELYVAADAADFPQLRLIGSHANVLAAQAGFPKLHEVGGEMFIGRDENNFPRLEQVRGLIVGGHHASLPALRTVEGALRIEAEGASMPVLTSVGSLIAGGRIAFMPRLQRDGDRSPDHSMPPSRDEQASEPDAGLKKAITITLVREPHIRSTSDGRKLLIFEGTEDGRMTPLSAVHEVGDRDGRHGAVLEERLRRIGGGDRVTVAGQWVRHRWAGPDSSSHERWEFRTSRFRAGDHTLAQMGGATPAAAIDDTAPPRTSAGMPWPHRDLGR